MNHLDNIIQFLINLGQILATMFVFWLVGWVLVDWINSGLLEQETGRVIVSCVCLMGGLLYGILK